MPTSYMPADCLFDDPEVMDPEDNEMESTEDE